MPAPLWRSGWDSNPRDVSIKLISSQPRYDHFDTAAQYRLLYTQPPEKSRLIFALDRGISQCYTIPGTSQCDISR